LHHKTDLPSASFQKKLNKEKDGEREEQFSLRGPAKNSEEVVCGVMRNSNMRPKLAKYKHKKLLPFRSKFALVRQEKRMHTITVNIVN